MSVTIAATPILLISFSKIAALMTAAAFSGTFYAAAAGTTGIKEEDSIATQQFAEINNNVKRIMSENHNEITEEVAHEVMDIICREYNTVFVSQEVLLKTLEEHGFENIETNGDKISCEMDVLKLDFYKSENSAEEPYMMKITAGCSDEEINALLDNITSEYTSNSQEESYIKIKERLENQGLKIDEEEVYEDDTIVLTVNIN